MEIHEIFHSRDQDRIKNLILVSCSDELDGNH